ncbi:MAG: HAMP domain-containing protein [Ignavibacteria bacterium]|nr:HAMP domain-containing protein [Ignavibacteria bacterium]
MPSIRTRISFTYLLIAAIVLVLLGTLLSLEFERSLRERIVAELKTTSLVVHSFLLETAPKRAWMQETRKTLEIIASTTSIRITLIDGEGTVLFESAVPDSMKHLLANHLQRPEVQRALKRGEGTDVRMSETIGLEMMYHAHRVDPVQFEQSIFPRLRFIRSGIPLSEVNSHIATIRLKITIAAFLVFLVTLVASRIVARRVTDPIAKMSADVARIKAGEIDIRLPIQSDDEIAKLAELINEMTTKLRDDIAQLRKLERYRTEFLGNVSHELRTPIFSLKGYLETLLDGAIDDSTVRRSFLEKAYHHASRLDTLLNDLIEISRIESGQMKFSFRFFEVQPFLKEVIADHQHASQRKSQDLRCELPDEAPLVYGDRDRLRQALGNIIDNAIRYSPEGASIVVNAGRSDDTLVISVHDSGPGIDPIHLSRIFERFYRIDQDRSREAGGTGLGLAISKHIVEAHGQKIVVESTPGSGSTFSFHLRTS